MSRHTPAAKWSPIRDCALKRLSALSLIVALSACGGGSGDTTAPELPPDDSVIIAVSDPNQCNAATQKQWAYDSMRDFYLFYDQVPVVDPQSFASANDLVQSVRFQERDGFSNVGSATRSSLEFDEGREFGLGYGWRLDEQNNARIALVIDDSPFGRAGIERGDIILSVDGFDWSDQTLATGFSDRVFGTPENPATATWRFSKRDTGQIVELPLTAAEYAINTVLAASILTSNTYNGVLGYLAFNRFLNTSERELDAVFASFRARNVTELVLDMRYNGGGRVSVAQQLASLIAGDRNAGRAIANYRFNDKYTDKNFTLEFLPDVGDLGLSRVIVLTSGRTASASELVIAGLQPYIEVITIGTRTTGKPYIQLPYDRCDERLALIEAEGFNDANVSVFGGIPALCYAEDDPGRDFGLNDDGEFEGFLGTAIDYVLTGACATAPALAAGRSSTLSASADTLPDRQGIFPTGGALADQVNK